MFAKKSNDKSTHPINRIVNYPDLARFRSGVLVLSCLHVSRFKYVQEQLGSKSFTLGDLYPNLHFTPNEGASMSGWIIALERGEECLCVELCETEG
jgi:hypothetical protein